MPYLDGTGPRGQGPRTGGGFGNCPPINQPNQQLQNPTQRIGRGLGSCGRGMGWGRRGRF